MAKKIQAWTEFGPRLEPATPLSGEELIEQITEGSNESMSSVLAVLSALDRAMEQALKTGRIVRLPNGTHYRPIGKRDGSIKIRVRVNPFTIRDVNDNFRGVWLNAENVDKSTEEIYTLWNEAHPDDPVEP
jgi:hypothetical protein